MDAIYTGISRKLKFRLTRGTTWINLICYLLASLLTISLFVFLNSAQSFVLLNVLDLPLNEVGNTNGSLVFYDELLSLAFLGLWGIISDRIGRMSVYVYGFITMGSAIISYPFAENVYPDLLVRRLIFGNGAAACSAMVTAILSDYIHDKDKGKASGIVGLFSGLGAVLGAFGFVGLPDYLLSANGNVKQAITKSFVIVGCISIVFGLVCLLGLRKSNASNFDPEIDSAYTEIAVNDNSDIDEDISFEYDTEQSDLQVNDPLLSTRMRPDQSASNVELNSTRESFYAHFKGKLNEIYQGIALSLKMPHVLLGYLGGFVARGDSIIITLFLPLWVGKFYREQGLCPSVTSLLSIMGKIPSGNPLKQCKLAFRRAYALTGTAQTFALIGAPIFGFLSDRYNRTKIFVVAALISCVSYGSLFFVSSPKDPVVFGQMIFVGLGEIGMIVTSLSLVTANIPQEIKGAVAGGYSLFGGLGVLFLSKVGGLIFDKWTETSVFLLVGLVSLFVAGGGTFKILKHKK